MNKFKTISKYFIIAILFAVTVLVVIPTEVNAGDGSDPYHSCMINPINK